MASQQGGSDRNICCELLRVTAFLVYARKVKQTSQRRVGRLPYVFQLIADRRENKKLESNHVAARRVNTQ